jgi:cyclic beta-1,2-glucan synthetase
MHRAGLESILGLRRRGSTFEMDPCIPSSWPEYEISWLYGRTRYVIVVSNPGHRCRGVASAELDGAAVDPRAIALIQDGGTHKVRLVMGEPAAHSAGRTSAALERG